MSEVSLKDKLIGQLIRDSLNKNLSWSPKKPPASLSSATDNYIPLYLETWYKNVIVGIYEIRYKYFVDEEAFHWSEMNGICVVKLDGVLAWKVEENSPALRELIQIAGEKAAGLDELFDVL